MPSQGTRKDPASLKAQDKESKRARGALSCAECRRLKLKCDKTVPCSSCKRRGCSAICPNGSLITGQGTRFVLADTEKLHQKIGQMSDRIRQLEDALAILQSTTHANEPHPLLDRELMKVKSSIELHSAINGEDTPDTPHMEELEDSQYIDAFGTLAIRDDGAATFYGRSAGSESLLMGASVSEDYLPPVSGYRPKSQAWQNAVPEDISRLADIFPLTTAKAGVNLDDLITHLPSWHDALRLVDLYLQSSLWFFGAVTKQQLMEETLLMWYQEAPRHNADSSLHHSTPTITTPATAGAGFVSSATQRSSHDLALLFVVFCFGAMTDINLPPAPDNPLSEHYYILTKASLTLEPLLDRPPSVSTVQTLSLMAIYQGLHNGENSIESTWAIMGMATKLAQSIGLHRDSARWKLTPSETQKRRALFWELFITDGWQSLATGRLATFSLPFVDCELPADPDQTIAEDGTMLPGFPFWKARFGAECVAPVVQGTLTSRAPKYSVILELDRKVRDIELPKYSMGPPPENADLSQTMRHFMPINYRHLTLLYIHRCFFAHAISSHPLDPIKSPYAPSFLAGYRSACEMIKSVKYQFTLFPDQIARFWVLWTHAFSSIVMLSSVVTHGPKSKIAPAALLELGTACDLFENAAKYGGRAVKFLPIVMRLREKAQRAYYDTVSGIPPAVANDIFRSSADERQDEMSIFSGKTYTLTTKVSPSSRSSGPSPDHDRSPSDSPPQAHASHPSFSGVHPSLISELSDFDGQIEHQIQAAYREDSVSFNQQLMGHHTPPEHFHVEQHVPSFQSSYMQQGTAPHVEYQQQRAHTQMGPPPPPQNQMEPPREHIVEHVRPNPRIDVSYHYESSESSYTVTNSPVESHYVTSPAHPHMQYSHGMPGMPGPPPAVARHTLPHSRSHPNLHQARASYQDYENRNGHSQQQHEQPSHEMYSVPPEYMPQHQNQQHLHHNVSPISPTGAPTYPPQDHYRAPDNISQSHSISSQYWNNHAEGSTASHHVYSKSGYLQPQYHTHSNFQQPTHSQMHYAHGDMKGMVAEDHGLQETWASYMSQVGSPRLMLGD